MTESDLAACLRAPSERELRGRLYRGLAEELAGATTRGVVLIEATAPGPDPPTVTVRPAEVATAVLAGTAFQALVARAVREPPPRPPSAGVADALTWVLGPMRRAPAAPAFAGAWDPPALDSLLGPTGRLDTQTFWLAGRSDGRVWAGRRVRFCAASRAELERRGPGVARAVVGEWSRASGIRMLARELRNGAHDWDRAALGRWPRSAWIAAPAALASRLAEPLVGDAVLLAEPRDGHTVVLGASGAGKTTFLADAAARAVHEGSAVLALDLHGDLAPGILGRLGPAERHRLIAIDAGRRPVVGVAALAGQGDREAAQLVAAIKRLSPDGTDVYWGFRLERIFDAFVRLVQETGGTLADLYGLLTDVDRRETARLATRSPELARFLDELAPVLRRNPDFLWSAAARLAKVVLVPELAELLAPADGGLPVEELLHDGRSILIRVPFTEVGPEAATFAASLLLARIYLGLAAHRGPDGRCSRVVVVLDEVQGFSPRLVSEMLTEGRKFGLRLVLASQYPERFAPELRHAAAGVGRTVVAFRAPRASAEEVGRWLGLGPVEAREALCDLPVGLGVARAPGSGELRTVAAGPTEGPGVGWESAVLRTLAEFPQDVPGGPAESDAATERLLLAALAAEERGRPLGAGELVDGALTLPGERPDPAVLEDRAAGLERTGLASAAGGTWRLTPAGERRLGLLTSTGATKETAEHRALLLRCFRLLARRGLRLEIVRQGRYDTALPDARLRLLPEGARLAPPRELAAAISAVQKGWAWRFFAGRDVHVEAEVSGALRPARVRHGLAKARARGAFALFVVGDAGRAAKVRRTLRAEGASVRDAQVWTLRGGPVGRDGSPRDGKPRDP